MRILLAHNSYQQRGGEDAVFEDEARLLADNGHEVHLLQRHNRDVAGQPAWRSAIEAVWSARSAAEMAALVQRLQPQVLHVHNTFPLLSPAILPAAAKRGAAVVATLHNARLICLQASFTRDGRPCHDCLGRAPWRGVVHGCYRQSRPQSAVLAASLLAHRALGTWRHHVHRFIVLNDNARAQFVELGLAAERLCVKPNFAWSDDAQPSGVTPPRSGGLFVGRLTAEKGAVLLADALRRLPDLPFTVVGAGPEAGAFEGTTARLAGALPPAAVRQAMQRARFLVVPSQTPEQFPRVVAEAFACGLPVIASDKPPLGELTGAMDRGCTFAAHSAAALLERLRWACDHPDALAAMGERARAYHREHLSPTAAHRQLMDIYTAALAESAQRRAAA